MYRAWCQNLYPEECEERQVINLKVLLVEPDFPYPSKSKNRANEIHKNFVPIGLLKLGAFYKSSGSKVKLVRGNQTKNKLRFFHPSLILITSIFTSGFNLCNFS